jgi:hypothetical protein
MQQKRQQQLTRGLSNNKHNDKDDKVETHAISVETQFIIGVNSTINITPIRNLMCGAN